MSDERRRSTASLEAPERKGVEDPGAHELGEFVCFQHLPHDPAAALDKRKKKPPKNISLTLCSQESDSDEHFSDAHSAIHRSSESTSPIPRTRVERVDDDPAYGEVPGTEAYNKRTEDATPDEIAVLSDPARSETTVRSPSPGGHPIPKTVVDETEDSPDSKTHHYHEQLHKADATPDMVHKPDGTGEANPLPSAAGSSEEGSGTAAKSS